MVKRNLCKMPLILAALALSLAMFLASCGDSGGGGGRTVQNTEGRLEISGLGDFVGYSYRIFAQGGSDDPFHVFWAGERRGLTGSFNNPMIRTVYIDADSVTLYLWENAYDDGLLSFTSGLVPDDFDVYIVRRDISGLEMDAMLEYLDGYGSQPVFFVELGELASISTSGYQVSGTFQASH